MASKSSQKAGRKPTGSVVEKTNRKGRVFALRFRAYGERQYETLGGECDGWTRELADEELERRLAQVKLGQYVPPSRVEPESTDEPEPMFGVLAWEWLADQALAESTRDRYRLDVLELVGFFGEQRCSDIDARRLDEYKRHMRRRTKKNGQPLSHETINKTLVRLGGILQRAKRYGYVSENVARDEGVRLKTTKPERSYLNSADQITALLDAAKELDGRSMNKTRPYRHAMLATLVFAGLRLGEALALRWRDVDLAGGWLRVKQDGDGKTEAATREVKIRPVLREVLADRKAAMGASPHELVFPTRSGEQHSQSNIRSRVTAPARERANERLDTPLPKLTPQALRRTFASVLYAIGVQPPEVMQEMGHTDPKLALRVYAQAMRRDEGERERLRALVGTDEVLVPESTSIEANPILAS